MNIHLKVTDYRRTLHTLTACGLLRFQSRQFVHDAFADAVLDRKYLRDMASL